MSLDYPDYVELKKRKLWFLACLWKLGDLGYYLGLLGALMVSVWIFVSFLMPSIRSGATDGFWRAMLGQVIMFSGFALILVLSLALKNYARKKGGDKRGQATF